MPSRRSSRPRSTAARTRRLVVTHSLPLTPTKTGVPISSTARRGRVPSERCVIVRGALLDERPREQPPCRVDVSGTRTKLSEHQFFFMPSSLLARYTCIRGAAAATCRRQPRMPAAR
jgi:hypothetical protein